jgi:hypothetical protein
VPLAKLQFKPGVDKESTSYGAEGSWFDSNLIRFRKGNPEKMGGWTRLSGTAIEGTGRSLHIWSALDGARYMGVGTDSKFYVEEGGAFNDITPLRRTVTLSSNPFTTGASGSAVVTVTDPGHGAVTFDFVSFSGATTTDGILAAQLNTEFQITVVDANSYTITTAGTASSGSVAGGGTPIASYQINVGLAVSVAGIGFGSGFFGGPTTTYSQTTLNGLISDSATSIILTDATDFETAATTITAGMTLLSDIITLSSGSAFPTQGTVIIGTEKIRYGTRVGNTLSDLTRGTDGTTTAIHSTSATITFVGLIQIEDELIQYTGKTSQTLDAGVVRGVRGTTAAAHADTTIVKEANDFITWGGATSATSSQQLRLWSQDNWGEDLIFNPIDNTPYYWDKTLGLGARATALSAQTGASDAPTIVRRLFISGTDRHVIAFGCNPVGETDQDLLQVRWSDQEDPVNWTPSATNTAGGQRISSGSEIISAQKTRQEILIWTDLNLHAMRFVGAPFTFGFSLLASNISVIGPNAVTTVGDQIFWMDQENFYVYTGQIQAIPCSVLKYIFTDINLAQSGKIFAASNRMFNEVLWFYCSSDSNEIDKYVKLNYAEGVWDVGSLVRTAWIDKGIHDNPRAIGISDGSNLVYIQENGRTDDGSAMTSFIESGDVDIGDGEQFSFISRIIPDIDITSSDSATTVDYILKTRDFPGDSLSVNSTTSVSSTTQEAFLRARARQAVLRIESTAIDVEWVLGDTRLQLKPDGRR